MGVYGKDWYIPPAAQRTLTSTRAQRIPLVLFSDGAVEIQNAQREMLDVDGLIGILKKQGYPATDLCMETLEEELLLYSNGIRLDDDLTLIEIRF